MNFQVQWFPGHMTKAKRMMESQIKLVDVVVEMLDARIPLSCSNPMLGDIIGNKPKVVALNKTDMADPERTEEWVEYYKSQGLAVVLVDCANGKGIKALIAAINKAAAVVQAKWLKKGVKNRPTRVMIVGIPNVGKSTLINRLVGKTKVVAANRPGVTRGQQWVTIAKGLELLDTPGVLWPKFDNPHIGFGLAMTGAIKEDVFDKEKGVNALLAFLRVKYPRQLADKYKIEVNDTDEATVLLEKIAKVRGALKAGGVLDLDKIRNLVLHDFKTAKMGRFTLDEVPDV